MGHIILRVTSGRRQRTVAGVAAALAGLGLFAGTVYWAGVHEILTQVRLVGWTGFAAILTLSGARLVARSLAWAQCMQGEGRLGFANALRATLMGEALGNVTPFATVLSEPAKAVFVRDRVPLVAAMSAVVVENIVYATSVALMIMLGAVAFLLSFDMPRGVRLGTFAAIGAMALVVAAAFAVLGTRARVLSGFVDRLDGRGMSPRWLASRAERIRKFEDGIGSFATRHPRQLLAVVLLETAFHAAGVAEGYVTLRLVATTFVPTLLTALIFESTGRLINVVFRFVPMRLGVDEAGSGLVAHVLTQYTAPGVTLGIVRKARVLVWTGVGVALLLGRGFSIRRAIEETATFTTDRARR